MRNPQDQAWMMEAIRLAGLGEGLTRPNPPVGAVLVRGSRMVGKGWHRKAGGAHAEIFALRQAGAAARGATLYVTLEPCSTWGRTPPCTDAILSAGVKRVVAAIRDPNPKHSGRGLKLLRKAGIQVSTGVCRKEAEALAGPFAKRMLAGRPMTVLKLAVSLDGKIADCTGHSKWISGNRSRKRVQELRTRCDAVIVGAGTVMADDPSLLPRPARGRKPLRVIVDGRGHVSPDARVFMKPSAGQTIVATTRRCSDARCRAYHAAGAKVWVLPGDRSGVSLRALLRRLAEAGAMRVLIEGGGVLAESFLRGGLVDEVVLFFAPVLLGGGGVCSVGGPGWLLKKAPRLSLQECRRSGGDVMACYTVER